MYFQDLILTLQHYWNEKGCLLTQPYDVEKGAGTFNPATFLRSLGPEPFNAAYAEPCRRPTDGRYGDNPIRMQHYYQFQVILKPNPVDIVDLYLGSLRAIGITPEDHDIRFVHDDWESPTLGAWGLGWEVWADGMEVTQFTYFQQVGGFELDAVCGEITYGLERLCMFLQGVDNVFELKYNDTYLYGDLFHENEVQGSRHNFELADVEMHTDMFAKFEHECNRLCDAENPVAAADYCLKASHSFNLLDARGAISVNERQNYILKVRTLARRVAEAWMANREALGFPLLERMPKAADVEAAEVATPDVSKLPDEAPLLIELGVEEMPAQVFASLLRQLPELFKKFFEPTRLDPEDVKFYVTPRRIVVSIGSIKTSQDDEMQELKGPPMKIARDADGNWTKAAEGFARKNGIELSEAEVRDLKGVEYLFVKKEEKGLSAVDVLKDVIPQFFDAIHWYKTMRWSTKKAQFVRPVQWFAAILGDVVIPCSYAGVQSGNAVYGHRFLSNELIEVSSDRETYLKTMADKQVLVDHEARKYTIREQVKACCADKGVEWVKDEELLDEVTHLVEYPVPVICEFDEKYLAIPGKVLITEMKGHQRYFGCQKSDGSISNHFVAISNMTCNDMDLVGQGYEKVLRSRFDDARFFLEDDVKIKLEERLPMLDGITYQAKLGSIGDKVGRIRRLAAAIADKLGLDNTTVGQIDQIATLCKCDLTTKMVYEFTELQGEIGRHYATQEGIDPVVANGIREHYMPKSVNDEFPSSVAAAVVGLADRIDSLVGISAATKLPTGSADPFALRRACLTSIATIVEKDFALDYRDLLETAFEIYGDTLVGKDKDGLVNDLLDFTLLRAKGLFRDTSCEQIPGGFAYDSIDAVAQASMPWVDLTDFVKRIQAMEEFRKRDDFADVAGTFKRCNNILKERVAGDVNADLFEQDQEHNLLAAIETCESKLSKLLPKHDYVAAMAEIGPLREVVDRFFDGVMVNADDEPVRMNRHLLVQRVVDQVLQMADFSAIQ